MSIRPASKAGPKSSTELSVIASIMEGLRSVWHDPLLRIMFVIVAAMNFLFVGPLLVGIPYLAATQLPEGAAAFGLIMSAYGGGNLLGYVVSGATGQSRHLGIILSAVVGVFGAGLILLGFTTSTAFAFLILLALGIGNGYIAIVVITWLQKRTSPVLLGRVMSLLLFASVGLVPISQALCGALIKWSLVGVFAAAGALMLLIALRAAAMSEIRGMGLEIIKQTGPKAA